MSREIFMNLEQIYRPFELELVGFTICIIIIFIYHSLAIDDE